MVDQRKERKVVTVLFCDLVGFTSRAEEMYPEDVAAVLAPYQVRLREELERYGGTVEKFIGDAVMALFGAPTAHEDDPERAVRAALAIRDFANEEGIELRIGITTGEALVTLDARPDAGETMATGDVVNTAARLQAPAVGRSQELALLEGALTRARQERSPQLVTLIGVPGIGKSRLVFELFQAVERDPDLISWRQGRCLPYGDGVTFWALGEIIKAQAGILETDSAKQTEEKLAAAARDPWVEAHLRPLVGLGAELELSGDRRGEAFAAWRRFLETLAEERPLVVLVEDLHWADETLLDFVDHLVEWARSVPLLVVCTARPELLERRPGWGGGKPNALTLSLSPLTNDETARLIGELLDRAVLPAETQEALLTRAGGNPLYAEQFARMFEERGEGVEWPLPETVQGIIAARLDLLAREEKALVQDAAVIGKVFWAGARAVKHQLAAEWIESLGRPEDQSELLAHHYLEALDLVRAAGGAVAPLAERARLSLRDAGDRAAALNALPSATRFYEAALELWPEDDGERPQLLFRYGSALRNTEGGAVILHDAYEALVEVGDDESAAEAQAMPATLAWHAGDRDRCFDHLERAGALLGDAPTSRAKAYLLAQFSRYRMVAGEGDEAVRVGREAMAMADELGLDEVLASALNSSGSARMQLGDKTGVQDLERSISIALAANSVECVRGYTNLASTLAGYGEIQRSAEINAEGIRAAERFGDEISLRFLRGQRATWLFCLGDWGPCDDLLDEFIAQSQTGSPHYLEADARWIRALLRLAREDPGGAVTDARTGLELARRTKDPQVVEPALGTAALVLHSVGQAQEAETLARELIDMWATAGRFALVEGGLRVVWVAVDIGLQERMLSVLERGLPSPWHEATRAIAAGNLLAAAEIYGDIGSRPDEAYARLRAADRLVGDGLLAEADEQLRRALAFYRSVGATRYVREGEALLAAAS